MNGMAIKLAMNPAMENTNNQSRTSFEKRTSIRVNPSMGNGPQAIIVPMSRTAAQALSLTGEDLTRSEFYDVVLQGRRVHLSPRAAKRMSAPYRVIQGV